MPDELRQEFGVPDELPVVEVQLNVGETIRIGNRMLTVMDVDGEESMLRVDRLPETAEADDDTRWLERPR